MKTLTILSFFLYSVITLGCDGFLPENNLYLPLDAKNEGLSREEYDAIIDKFEKIYSPIARRHGALLKIDRKWESGTVNAGTYRDENGKHWHINLYGGLARHRDMTKDAYLMVLCHEIGHHLGGAPKKIINNQVHWASTEGQSDYWAGLKCLRRVFEKEDNEIQLRGLSIPGMVIDECLQNFSSTADVTLCKRSSLAGQALAKVNWNARGGPAPNFSTPDPTVVEQTYDKHPMPQCRLDTYYQGTLCARSWNEAVSQKEELPGTCHPLNGHDKGIRPSCWYKSAVK